MSLPVLRLGSQGVHVRRLQSILKALKYNIIVDGGFGFGTLRTVKMYQTSRGLTSDGYVGGKTWEQLLKDEARTTPSDATSKNIWTKIRRFNSDVWYAVLPQDKYFVDFDLGVVSKFEKVSTIVKDKITKGKKPVCAINGGYFGGTNIEQMGLSMDEGSYKNVPDVKLIDLFYRKSDNKFHIDNWTKDTPNVWAQRNDFYWAMGTTYSLVQNGKINLENIGYHSHAYSRNPRTLIGQKQNGDIVFVVVDGRSSISRGVTAKESAQIAIELGLWQCVNGDGGGSTCGTEVVNDIVKVINKPSDGTERRVGSVLIAYEK